MQFSTLVCLIEELHRHHQNVSPWSVGAEFPVCPLMFKSANFLQWSYHLIDLCDRNSTYTLFIINCKQTVGWDPIFLIQILIKTPNEQFPNLYRNYLVSREICKKHFPISHVISGMHFHKVLQNSMVTHEICCVNFEFVNLIYVKL